jgi:hypothetical protein
MKFEGRAQGGSERGDVFEHQPVIGRPVQGADSRTPNTVMKMGDAGLEFDPAVSVSSVRARNVVGFQYGVNNLQLIAYSYDIEGPPTNFEATLARAGVRAALKELALAPDDRGLQQRADAKLANRPWLTGRPAADVAIDKAVVHTSEGGSAGRPVIDAYLFIQDCTGVQVANGGVQRIYHTFVVVPSVDEAQLLHDDPDLRRELIRYVCPAKDDEPDGVALRQQFAESLEGAVWRAPGLKTEGDLIDMRGKASVAVAGGYGVAVGYGGKQRSSVDIKVIVADELPAVDRYEFGGADAPAAGPEAPSHGLTYKVKNSRFGVDLAAGDPAQELARQAIEEGWRAAEERLRAITDSIRTSDWKKNRVSRPPVATGGATDASSPNELRRTWDCQLARCVLHCTAETGCKIHEVK